MAQVPILKDKQPQGAQFEATRNCPMTQRCHSRHTPATADEPGVGRMCKPPRMRLLQAILKRHHKKAIGSKIGRAGHFATLAAPASLFARRNATKNYALENGKERAISAKSG
ncbi:hypothetical protein UA08_06841 [Talaromyces atroroseus]|uniref:Uncharacterized protein n=1 Tax=Talaromyces atroroseus TaxID=1441469 RepID=A0A225AAL9_TALAT|nr:hypothetical protein UA08_06841 [Talaromyces atroroseus]OKL58021.1 hypothetical protein UA08_06841 [Talaromyces atroroseus]